LSFFKVPEIDLSDKKTDFDIIYLNFDDLMDKPWLLRTGFESLRVGGELVVHGRKGHYDKLKKLIDNEKLSLTRPMISKLNEDCIGEDNCDEQIFICFKLTTNTGTTIKMSSFSLKEELNYESLKMCDTIHFKKSPLFADEFVSSLLVSSRYGKLLNRVEIEEDEVELIKNAFGIITFESLC